MNLRGLLLWCAFIFLAMGPVSCSWDRPIQSPRGKTAEELYKKGSSEMEQKNYRQALETFYKLKYDFPTEAAAVMADLKIADAHYANEEYAEAVEGYEEVRKMHPASPYIPYVVYMLGMCHYHRSLSVDRDQTETEKALAEFQYLLTHFPNTPYAYDSYEKAKECMKKLSDHEVYVGNFYFRMNKYPAAIQRYEAALAKYPSVPLEDEVLFRLAEAYQATKQPEKAVRTLQVLAQQYPKSKYAQRAQKLLQGELANAQPALGVAGAQASSKQVQEAAAFRSATPPTPTPGVPQTTAPQESKDKPQTSKPMAPPSPPVREEREKPPGKPALEDGETDVLVSAQPASATDKREQAQEAKAAPQGGPAGEVERAESAQKESEQELLRHEPSQSGPVISSLSGNKPEVLSPAGSEVGEPSEPLPQPPGAETAGKQGQSTVVPSAMAGQDVEKGRGPETQRAQVLGGLAAQSASLSGSGEIASESSSPEPVSVRSRTRASSGKEEGVGFGELRSDKPINITADRMDAFQRNNRVIFEGNVVVQQEETYLYARRIVADMAPQEQGGGIRKVVAEDNVRITQNDRVATCDRAEFDHLKRTIELHGNPKIWQGKDWIDGEKVLVQLDQEKMVVVGSEEKRVSAVLHPKAKKAEREEPATTQEPKGRTKLTAPFALASSPPPQERPVQAALASPSTPTSQAQAASVMEKPEKGATREAVSPQAAALSAQSLRAEEEAARIAAKSASDSRETAGKEAPKPQRAAAVGGERTVPSEPVASFVERWRRAWESRDIEAFMSFYSKKFRSGAMDWNGWRAYKAAMFRKAGSIQVTTEALESKSLGARVRVSFVQHYRAERHQDQGRKELELVNEGGQWKIVAESWKPLQANAS